MKRAQIYLDDEVYEAVRTAAFHLRTSISSLMQQWAREKTLGAPKPVQSKGGLDAIIGMVHDSKRDVARRHDDYLWGDAS